VQRVREASAVEIGIGEAAVIVIDIDCRSPEAAILFRCEDAPLLRMNNDVAVAW
jgi:hypothetical protein